MAILKHVPSQNKNYSAVIEYLTMQHDEETGAVILDENGDMIEREGFLIQGINCTPDDFEELCVRDRLRFGVKGYASEVTTHQYILSFDPKDADHGLTVEVAQAEGLRFAQTYFPGHRMIVCTHPDGSSHSGNIHVHIVISALRFEDRIPEETYMRLRSDGSIKPSEYKAGCRHQDTARLRLHMQAHVQDFCRQNGFAVTPSRAKKKVNNLEYQAKVNAQKNLDRDNALRIKNGIQPVQTIQITKKEELRRVILDAVASTKSWESFVQKLNTSYTRQVEHGIEKGEIPYPVRQALWQEFKGSKESFWKIYKQLTESYVEQLEAAFRKLRTHQQSYARGASSRKTYREEMTKELRNQITALKSKQQKLRLTGKVYQTYSKAAALALSNGMEEEARICLEQMDALTGRLEGRWTDGWQRDGLSRSLLNGKVQTRATWLQTRMDEFNTAESLLNHIQQVMKETEKMQPAITEEPFPVEVKVTRGVISFKHPDMEHWVRGKSLGSEYDLEAISQKLNHQKHTAKEKAR